MYKHIDALMSKKLYLCIDNIYVHVHICVSVCAVSLPSFAPIPSSKSFSQLQASHEYQ